MYLYDLNTLATRNQKYANSSSNYHVIMMVLNLKKINKSKISKKIRISVARSTEVKQIVICVRHVVKRPKNWKTARADFWHVGIFLA